MSDRCEPPEHLRGVDGLHWIQNLQLGPETQIAHWSGVTMSWMSGFVPQIAADAHQYNWRYLAPVAPPDLVRALVEALTEASSAMQAACERDNLMTDDDAETITKARAALQRAKETGV